MIIKINVIIWSKKKNSKSNHELLFATPDKQIPIIKSESSDINTKKWKKYKNRS